MSGKMTLREAMVEADRRERNATDRREKARWCAVWWRLSARESKTPEVFRNYARWVLARWQDYRE